jgi:hypothetical protein
MNKVTNSRLEAGRGDILRLGRLMMLDRIVPLGSFAGGPGARSCLILAILHWLGRPLFLLLVRQEDRLTALYRKVKARRGGE